MKLKKILNSTPKERQLWYWRKEMESCHRYMRVYPKDSRTTSTGTSVMYQQSKHTMNCREWI